MKKKIVIAIVAAVLVLALIVTGVVVLLKSGFNNDKGTESNNSSTGSTASSLEPIGESEIIVGSVEGKVGERVKVPVEIKGNPGFMAALLKFKYDTGSLKYVSYHKGDFLTDYEVYDVNGTLSFITAENQDVKDNGVVVYFEFEILKDAKTSDIEVIKDDDTMLCNYNEQVISIKGTNGKITVK